MLNKIIVAITGASGSIYAKILLDKLLQLKNQWQELGVVMSSNAKDVWQAELGSTSYNQYDVKFYSMHDFAAPFASGSAKYNIMFVTPCSMGTLGRIANGISDDLITRAADVILKEKRKLILTVREMPYNLVHIKNMETVTLAGGIICPATPLFYSQPKTIEDLAATVVDRILNLAEFDVNSFCWGK